MGLPLSLGGRVDRLLTARTLDTRLSLINPQKSEYGRRRFVGATNTRGRAAGPSCLPGAQPGRGPPPKGGPTYPRGVSRSRGTIGPPWRLFLPSGDRRLPDAIRPA